MFRRIKQGVKEKVGRAAITRSVPPSFCDSKELSSISIFACFFRLPPDVDRNIQLTVDMKKYCSDMESTVGGAFSAFKSSGLTKFEKFGQRLDKIGCKKKNIKKVSI